MNVITPCRFFFVFCFILYHFSKIQYCYANPIPESQMNKYNTVDSGGVLRATLKNGMRVIIVKNSLAPVVTTEMNYMVGSDEAPQGFPGTAHALEHMMFRGSPGLSASQLSDISALMGAANNAQTRQMVTQYYFTIPAQYLGIALRIESIRMRGILCTDSLWDKERGAIKQEVAQDLSIPLYLFITKLNQLLFSGTPYAYDALGTDSSFDKTTASMLTKFHSQWYVPNNAVLVVAGDVNQQKALQEIKQYFEDIPAGNLPQRPDFNFSEVKHEKLEMSTDLPNGLLVIAYRFPGSGSSQYAAAQILSDVLSSERGRLYQLVIEGRTLSIEFDYEPLLEAGIGFLVAEFPKDSNPDDLKQAIDSIISLELTNSFDSNLVQAAKLQGITRAELQKNSIEGLASVWSDAVAIRKRNSPDEDLAALQKVSVDDVNRCARTFIDSTHSIVSVLTPQSSGREVQSGSYGGTESFSSKEAKGVKLPSWADSALGKITIPNSNINPVITKLPNGINLIVQPESISNTISVYGEINNNPYLQQPANQEGIADILDQLFEFGSKSLDRISLARALDSIGADMSVGTSFSLQMLKQHFSRGVYLLADNLLHPGFSEDAFKIIQQRISFFAAGQRESPDYITGRAIRKAILTKGDPELREPIPEKINLLTLQDVSSYYNRVFRPDMTTIVVIGNVSADTVKEIIWKNFKDWKSTGAKPQTDFPPVPLNKATSIVVPDKSRVQDMVFLAQILNIKRSDPDYYTLQLGNLIFGGSNFSSKLYQDLRVNSGLVYHAGSSLDVSRTRGVFLVTFACDPGNVSKARSIVTQNLQQMRTRSLQQSEMNMARSLLIHEIPLSESSVKSIALGLLQRSLDDLPLDEPVRAAGYYLKSNPQDIKRVFSKWIFPENLAQIVEGPAPK